MTGDRINPLNKTIVEKLSTDWNEIKEHAHKYKPVEAGMEYEKLCKTIDHAIRDLHLQYKPIYELMVKLQNETQSRMSEEERAKMAEQTTIISLVY